MNRSNKDLANADLTGSSSQPDSEAIIGRARQSVRWVFWGRFGLQIVSIGFTMALARLLSPADFGLYGLAFVILQFVVQIESFRIETALVQTRNLDAGLFSAAWVFSIVCSVVAAIALFVLATPLGVLFESPSLAAILRVGSSVFVVRSLFMPTRILMKRTLRFDSMTVVEIIRIVPSGIVAVWMAIRGYGAWSLMAFYLLRELLGGLMLFGFVRGTLPGIRLSAGTGLRARIHYGIASTASEMLVYFIYNLPDLFIGRYIGAGSLGMYRQGVGLVGRPTAYIDDVLNKVAFPVLSRAWGDDELVRRGFLHAIRYIFAIALPVLGLLAILASDFVLLLFGSQWEAAVPVVRILAAIGVARMLQPLASSVFHAAGSPQTEARINIAALVMMLIMLVVIDPATIAQVATIVGVSYAALAFLGMYISSKRVGVNLVALLKVTYASILAGGLSVVVSFLAAASMEAAPLVIRVLVVTTMLFLAYGLVLWIVDRSIIADARALLFGKGSRSMPSEPVSSGSPDRPGRDGRNE